MSPTRFKSRLRLSIKIILQEKNWKLYSNVTPSKILRIWMVLLYFSFRKICGYNKGMLKNRSQRFAVFPRNTTACVLFLLLLRLLVFLPAMSEASELIVKFLSIADSGVDHLRSDIRMDISIFIRLMTKRYGSHLHLRSCIKWN